MTGSDTGITSTWMMYQDNAADVARGINDTLGTTINTIITMSPREIETAYFSLSETALASWITYWITNSKLLRFALKLFSN